MTAVDSAKETALPPCDAGAACSLKTAVTCLRHSSLLCSHFELSLPFADLKDSERQPEEEPSHTWECKSPTVSLWTAGATSGMLRDS